MDFTVDVSGERVAQMNPGGQADFCADWTHEWVGFEAGWGAGKSHGGARKLLTLHVHNAFDALGIPTGVKSAAIATTYSLAKSAMAPMLMEAAEEFKMRPVFFLSSKNADMAIYFNNRVLRPILIRSADHPDRLTAWQVGAAWCEEPSRWKRDKDNPRNDPLIQVMGRVRDPKARFRQIICTYTNEGDDTQVYELFHDGKANRALYRAATQENPAMREWADGLKSELSPEAYEQYVEGKAASYHGGRAYSQFDDMTNVDAEIKPETVLPLQLSLDFNIRPGMHAVIGQQRPDDVLLALDEIHAPRLDVRGTVRRFKSWVEEQGGFKWPELQVFGDSTGSSGWAGTGQSCYDILFDGLDEMQVPYINRVPTQNPAVTDRLNSFNSALKDARGDVHYLINPRCERLLHDLRKLRQDDQGGIDKSEKSLSHASDAEGYRISYLRPSWTAAAERQDAVGGRVG